MTLQCWPMSDGGYCDHQWHESNESASQREVCRAKSKLFFVLNTILNQATNPSASAVGYEGASCHYHFHDIIGLLHGPKIICDAILHTLNGISVANFTPSLAKWLFILLPGTMVCR